MLRLRVVSVALAVIVGFIALGGPGGAQARPGRGQAAEPAEPAAGDELKLKAQELLSEGNRLASEGDFLAALNKFRAAYELYASPKLLLNIGTSLRQIGRFAEAATTYEQYLADPEADPSHSNEVRTALDEIGQLVGYLELAVSESGARVVLDGRPLRDEERGAPVRVDPGHHTVVAEKEGWATTVRQVQVVSGTTVQVDLPLVAPGEAPPEPIPVRPIVGYGIAGLGAAAIITGVIFGILAGTKDAESDDHCAAGGDFAGYCTQEGADLKATAQDLSVAGLVTGIAGFAVGVGGLAIALTTAEEPEAAAQTPTVAVAPGLQVEITW